MVSIAPRPVQQGVSNRLLLVSNRAPIEHCPDVEGRVRARPTDGGVATALESVSHYAPVTWIASAATVEDQELAAEGHAIELGVENKLRFVSSAREAYELHYNTFCNPVLWFLHHGLWSHLRRNQLDDQIRDAWKRGYVPVNQMFATAVVDELTRGHCDAVMLHDYHLYSAPGMIRARRPSTRLQHFIHVPWPQPEAWECLPRSIALSILRGLLANDSVIFQTTESAENFLLTCCAFVPDADVAVSSGRWEVRHPNGRTSVWTNPMSVSATDLRACLAQEQAQQYRDELSQIPGKRTIVRVDRLDPSKNIANGFEAFNQLLSQHSEWIGKVTFLAFLVPSRTGIPEYQAHASDVFGLISRINARYQRDDWQPIHVFYESNRVKALVALARADVLLVNSLADGMNLVAKEGAIVNERDGVLVLSRAAGAYCELRDAALTVEPLDVDGTADALHDALVMPAMERHDRSLDLRRAVLTQGLDKWLRAQLEDIAAG